MKTKNKYPYTYLRHFCFAISLFLLALNTKAQDIDKYADLSGLWKFHLGDNMQWSEPDYDDSHWENIKVPSSWEAQGFYGYNGFAWYRTRIYTPLNTNNSSYYLSLGYIDDVDEVYINGKKIGSSGRFPNNYTTAYNAHRIYAIPNYLIRENEPLSIAIRVYDDGGEGGIIHGTVAILVDFTAVNTEFDLSGDWKFRIGKCKENPQADDYSNWDEIIVPGAWEDQGYKDYDGLACYVKEFFLEGQFDNKRMVLLLGRIDDLDMAYLNGKLIGQSGEFAVETVEIRNETFKQFRAYYIPQDILIDNGKNVLTVKVYDHSGMGGIWSGTIGLISQDKYIQYWRNRIRNHR